MRVLAALALFAVAGCPAPAKHVVLDGPTRPPDATPVGPGPTDWHGRSIYFVVTDRFANGDPSNDSAGGFAANPTDVKGWHGGDFQGLIDRLDYIAGLGFTGLWITPVIEQHDVHGYHGYWGWDWTHVDPHLGDLAKLKELVDAAHARGIAVMIDTVANHTGRYNYQSPTFPDAAMYHHNGSITNWSDPNQLENYDVSGLNDLAQENPAVHDKLLDHVRWLLASTGADGLRIDTAKHVPKTFWADYVAAANTFTIGEVLDGSPDFVAPYSHVLAATLDYPLYFPIHDVFAKGASARGLGAVLAKDAAYSDPLLSGVFVDNHDQSRFLCEDGGSVPQLELALAFALTVRGIPIIYYGTDQGLGSCANNREDMPATPDPSHPIASYLKQLNAIRAASAALRVGTQLERWQDDTAYAFEREAGTSAAVVAFNLSAATRTLPLQNLHVPAGTAFHDALGTAATVTVDAGKNLAVTVPAHAVVILTN